MKMEVASHGIEVEHLAFATILQTQQMIFLELQVSLCLWYLVMFQMEHIRGTRHM